jgi:hypothetical protein
MQMTSRKFAAGVLLVGGTLLASACLERELVPLNPCLVSGVSRKVAVNNVDKVDLLFMVDNSNSMADKQVSLKAQFPKLITVLTTGERMPGDPNPFPPVKDMHVGVVSSDMGLPGVANRFGCDPNGGDDGRLQHMPKAGGVGCMANYPAFLTYSAAMMTNQAQFATDFQCIATLGTGGCGFEEQLEAPLKALWPSIYTDAKGNVVTPNPITFLATTAAGTLGKGDVPVAQGGNLGFLRNDPITGLSLIAVVVLTDEEDCSPRTTEHLKPPDQYAADSPYKNEDINLRCHYNPDKSYDVQNRYLKGFKALRAGNENLVIFAAITGVPTDLVDAKARGAVDFTDANQRNAYYDGILADPRMQETIDPSTNPGMGSGNLVPSCSGTDSAGHSLVAQPPRRIVTLAKLFGENGVIQSICQSDFGPAMDAIIDVIAKQLGAVCLPRPLVRKADRMVGCNVVWELPKPGTAPMTTATDCSQLPFLGPVESGRAPINDRGGNNCVVTQLGVSEADFAAKTPPSMGEGWYYDNYSADLAKQCPLNQPQRVAFTAGAKPPTGVVVKLECLNETQRIANTRKDVSTAMVQPEIGTPCGTDQTQTAGSTVATGDAACIVTLNNGMQDTSMFCHPQLEVCARACSSDTDCPPAWVCDTRAASMASANGKSFCVNPTCGSE